MNRLTKAMIRVSVNRGLDEILDNSERGTRNLVDLGDQFAKGKYQKLFFNIAQQQLSDPNSPYYRIVEKVIKNTDRELLTDFGINLAYNGWTYGANEIRRLEQQGGYNIPWAIFFTLGQGATIGMEDISAIIGQGKRLGIFSYIFAVDDGYDLSPLLGLMALEKDCAFELLAPPAMLKGRAEEIRAAGSLLVVLDLQADDGDLRDAAQQLLGQGCLCGGFARYEDFLTALNQQSLYDCAEAHNIPFLVLVDALAEQREDIYRYENMLMEHWTSLDRPVFTTDFFMDLALVDRNISSEGCLATVLRDGSFVLCNTESHSITRCGSIQEHSLEEMFRVALPKG